MPDESEPEISAHANVVRSSNHQDHTILQVQLCFKQSTNLMDSRKRIVNEVRVGYSYRVSMVTKADIARPALLQTVYKLDGLTQTYRE